MKTTMKTRSFLGINPRNSKKHELKKITSSNRRKSGCKVEEANKENIFSLNKILSSVNNKKLANNDVIKTSKSSFNLQQSKNISKKNITKSINITNSKNSAIGGANIDGPKNLKNISIKNKIVTNSLNKDLKELDNYRNRNPKNFGNGLNGQSSSPSLTEYVGRDEMDKCMGHNHDFKCKDFNINQSCLINKGKNYDNDTSFNNPNQNDSYLEYIKDCECEFENCKVAPCIKQGMISDKIDFNCTTITSNLNTIGQNNKQNIRTNNVHISNLGDNINKTPINKKGNNNLNQKPHKKYGSIKVQKKKKEINKKEHKVYENQLFKDKSSCNYNQKSLPPARQTSTKSIYYKNEIMNKELVSSERSQARKSVNFTNSRTKSTDYNFNLEINNKCIKTFLEKKEQVNTISVSKENKLNSNNIKSIKFHIHNIKKCKNSRKSTSFDGKLNSLINLFEISELINKEFQKNKKSKSLSNVNDKSSSEKKTTPIGKENEQNKNNKKKEKKDIITGLANKSLTNSKNNIFNISNKKNNKDSKCEINICDKISTDNLTLRTIKNSSYGQAKEEMTEENTNQKNFSNPLGTSIASSEPKVIGLLMINDSPEQIVNQFSQRMINSNNNNNKQQESAQINNTSNNNIEQHQKNNYDHMNDEKFNREIGNNLLPEFCLNSINDEEKSYQWNKTNNIKIIENCKTIEADPSSINGINQKKIYQNLNKEIMNNLNKTDINNSQKEINLKYPNDNSRNENKIQEIKINMRISLTKFNISQNNKTNLFTVDRKNSLKVNNSNKNFNSFDLYENNICRNNSEIKKNSSTCASPLLKNGIYKHKSIENIKNGNYKNAFCPCKTSKITATPKINKISKENNIDKQYLFENNNSRNSNTNKSCNYLVIKNDNIYNNIKGCNSRQIQNSILHTEPNISSNVNDFHKKNEQFLSSFDNAINNQNQGNNTSLNNYNYNNEHIPNPETPVIDKNFSLNNLLPKVYAKPSAIFNCKHKQFIDISENKIVASLSVASFEKSGNDTNDMNKYEDEQEKQRDSLALKERFRKNPFQYSALYQFNKPNKIGGQKTERDNNMNYLRKTYIKKPTKINNRNNNNLPQSSADNNFLSIPLLCTNTNSGYSDLEHNSNKKNINLLITSKEKIPIGPSFTNKYCSYFISKKPVNLCLISKNRIKVFKLPLHKISFMSKSIIHLIKKPQNLICIYDKLYKRNGRIYSIPKISICFMRKLFQKQKEIKISNNILDKYNKEENNHRELTFKNSILNELEEKANSSQTNDKFFISNKVNILDFSLGPIVECTFNSNNNESMSNCLFKSQKENSFISEVSDNNNNNNDDNDNDNDNDNDKFNEKKMKKILKNQKNKNEIINESELFGKKNINNKRNGRKFKKVGPDFTFEEDKGLGCTEGDDNINDSIEELNQNKNKENTIEVVYNELNSNIGSLNNDSEMKITFGNNGSSNKKFSFRSTTEGRLGIDNFKSIESKFSDNFSNDHIEYDNNKIKLSTIFVHENMEKNDDFKINCIEFKEESLNMSSIKINERGKISKLKIKSIKGINDYKSIDKKYINLKKNKNKKYPVDNSADRDRNVNFKEKEDVPFIRNNKINKSFNKAMTNIIEESQKNFIQFSPKTKNLIENKTGGMSARYRYENILEEIEKQEKSPNKQKYNTYKIKKNLFDESLSLNNYDLLNNNKEIEDHVKIFSGSEEKGKSPTFAENKKYSNIVESSNDKKNKYIEILNKIDQEIFSKLEKRICKTELSCKKFNNSENKNKDNMDKDYNDSDSIKKNIDTEKKSSKSFFKLSEGKKHKANKAGNQVREFNLFLENDDYKQGIISELSNLTLDNFSIKLKKISNLILSEKNSTSSEFLDNQYIFVNIIMDKAILENKFSSLYAKLCNELHNNLLNKIKNEKYQNINSIFECENIKTIVEVSIHLRFDQLNNLTNNNMSSFGEGFNIIKKKFLGTIHLIAELIKVKIISQKFGIDCLECLYQNYICMNKEKEFQLKYLNLEGVTNLLKNLGKIIIERKSNKFIQILDSYINDKISIIINHKERSYDESIPNDLKNKILNLLNERKEEWTSNLRKIDEKNKISETEPNIKEYKEKENEKEIKILSSMKKKLNIWDSFYSAKKSGNKERKTREETSEKKEGNIHSFSCTNESKTSEDEISIAIKNDFDKFFNCLNIKKNLVLNDKDKGKKKEKEKYNNIEILIKDKEIQLEEIVYCFIEICIDYIDNESKVDKANSYIKKIIEYYFFLKKDEERLKSIHSNFADLFLSIDEIVSDNKHLYKIMGFLLQFLINNGLYLEQNLDEFANQEKNTIVNLSIVLKYAIIYSEDNLKDEFYNGFKQAKTFVNNKNNNIFYDYVTVPLKGVLKGV